MSRIEVKYTADEFIQSCFGEGIESAREYVEQNPKDFYGADDFAEVHRTQEWKQTKRFGSQRFEDYGGYSAGPGAWREDDTAFERYYKLLDE